MPRRCTVCAHPNREEVEKAVACGRSLRCLAHEFGLTKDAIHRHMRHPEDWLTKALSTERKRKSVRGNPDKTKPYRWKPGHSGNPSGVSSEPHDGELDALLRMFT